MLFFTSIASNYLPKARVLAKSIKAHMPEAKVYVVLCDKYPLNLNYQEPFDKLIQWTDLGIPVENMDQWLYMHSVVELCTAVKGFALLSFFKEGHEKVIYLDPDIVVYNNFSGISILLDKHSIIITPHQIEPEKEYKAIVDNEVESLRHGIYNLGFIAVSNSAEGLRFAQWWSDRLLHFCYDDVSRGLFTDQRWIDFVPVFFPGVCILREKNYNICTWNITNRNVYKNDIKKLMVEGLPLIFYHFSGFDSGDQELMLHRYGQNNSVLFEIRHDYIESLKLNGQAQLKNCPWAYKNYENNDCIEQDHRRIYRNRSDLMAAFPNPYRVGTGSYLEWYNCTWLLHESKQQNSTRN